MRKGKAMPASASRQRQLAPPGERFFEALRAAKSRVLMLDYDGTLAPFVVERDEAVPYAGVREAIQQIGASGSTRVVIVTGRALAEVEELLEAEPMPEVWAAHGWERRTAAGQYECFPLPPEAQRGLDAAAQAAKDARMGDRLEEKPASVAVHWRGLSPEQQHRVKTSAETLWRPIARREGLALEAFDGGLELRAPGRNKGTAARAILKDSPKDTFAVYLGDDVTDEDAFAALPSSGYGILVRPELHTTRASAWLRPPEQLLAFLKRWAIETGDRR